LKRVFTGWILFLLPTQQRWSTERNSKRRQPTAVIKQLLGKDDAWFVTAVRCQEACSAL